MLKHGAAAHCSTFHLAKELSITSLQQRFTEDMQVRNFSLVTQASYAREVPGFARYFNKSPELPKCATQQVSRELAARLNTELRDVLEPLLKEIESLNERIKEYDNLEKRRIKKNKEKMQEYGWHSPAFSWKELARVHGNLGFEIT